MKKYKRTDVESVGERMMRKILYVCHRVLRGFANRVLNKKVIAPRIFSNAILKYYAPIFKGHVINVSGWRDEDREGGTYREYFTNADSYTISNAATSEKGLGSTTSEIALDLSVPINLSQRQAYDVVLNHTTLEHIFELDTAFKNLCDLSRDAVILVIPTLQHIHFNEGYGDYNRLTPMGIVSYFEKNGFTTIVLQSNEQPFSPVYCFAIAVRDSVKYSALIEKNLDFSMGGELFGSKINTEHLGKHVSIE